MPIITGVAGAAQALAAADDLHPTQGRAAGILIRALSENTGIVTIGGPGGVRGTVTKYDETTPLFDAFLKKDEGVAVEIGTSKEATTGIRPSDYFLNFTHTGDKVCILPVVIR